MGQMTHAVFFGVRMAPPDEFEDGWYTLIDAYKRRPHASKFAPSTPYSDDFQGVGFWCAVGASGKDGVPYLSAFPLDDFGSASPEYEAALNRAKEEWVRFATWCAEPRKGGRGERAWSTPAVQLGEPRLWLVETEVA